MDLRLQDKVILVTGGAKGTGTAIVRACAAESAKVVQAVGNFDKLDAVVNAGVNDKVGLEHGSPDDFLDHFSNLVHDYSMANYALPYLKGSKGPHTTGQGWLADRGCVHLDRGLA
jgi:L-fucose dehydrogenase